MSSLIILSPGLLTTVQDEGRHGFQRFGLPVAGAMDVFSMRLANILVGNEPGEAVLETTLLGPEIIFTGKCRIAITGADMGAELNGKELELNSCIPVKKNSVLRFRGIRTGCRSYIAFSGGLELQPVLGSCSTYTRAGIGGLDGRALKAGDEITIRARKGKCPKIHIPEGLLSDIEAPINLRVLPGPEAGASADSEFGQLCSSAYRISEQSDRMGYRLVGSEIRHSVGTGDIVSAGVPSGTVQLPGNGQPIILLADRQTTGGYARIALVATVDLPLLGQAVPGQYVQFRECSMEEARAALLEKEAMLAALRK